MLSEVISPSRSIRQGVQLSLQRRALSLVGPEDKAKSADARYQKARRERLDKVRRVKEIRRRRKRLLDRARLDEPVEYRRRAGLVIRSGSARTAEGLLADDSTGRLVIVCERETARGRLAKGG